MESLHLLRKLKTFKAALLLGLAGLVLTTCTTSVAQLPTSRTAQDGERDTATVDAPDNQAPSGEEALQTPGPVISPAPADDQISGRVEGASQPVDQVSSTLETAAPSVHFRKKVRVHQPRLRVVGLPEAQRVANIRKIAGVSYATEFRVGQIPVGPRSTPVTVAAVDPKQFRALTPQVTADAVAVWQRIAEGDAAFTHDTGNRLKAELGSFVPVGTEGSTLRVGAYASNGIPPIADALVTVETAEGLQLTSRRDVLISLDDGADIATVSDQIERIARASVHVIEEPEARRAFLTGDDSKTAFEPFNYIDMGDGMIQIDPDWVARNIVRRDVPILGGEVVCHRLMVDQLAGALGEIEQRGLAKLIDPSQYGGCWVPRHIDFNPARPLSMHGWGLAADFNVSTNGLGMKPQLDPRVVEIFQRWGFVWGGNWSRPDGMHFELGALMNSPQG